MGCGQIGCISATDVVPLPEIEPSTFSSLTTLPSLANFLKQEFKIGADLKNYHHLCQAYDALKHPVTITQYLYKKISLFQDYIWITGLSFGAWLAKYEQIIKNIL